MTLNFPSAGKNHYKTSKKLDFEQKTHTEYISGMKFSPEQFITATSFMYLRKSYRIHVTFVC
jgi:hypothetical protein